MAKVTKSYEGLKTLIVQEQYLSTCPKEMAMHLKEGKPKNLTELGDVAENYIEAHATDIVFGLPRFRSAPPTTASSPARRCYLCEKVGHVQSQCSRGAPDNSLASPSKIQRAPYAQQKAGYSSQQVPRTPPRVQRSSQPRSPTRGQVPRCFLCNRLGHIARNCLSRPTAAMELQTQGKAFEGSQKVVAACQPRGSTSTSSTGMVCRIHKRDACLECNMPPASTHRHQAASILAVCQDCGTQLPVIADACHAPDKAQRMPVAEGSVEGKPVSVLRDTGCTTIVVRRSLVPDNQLTGQEEQCILIDGTVRYIPGAKIHIQTPFFSGLTTAICMDNPMFDLVIGNVPGVQDVFIPQPVGQTTRGVQTERQEKATKDLTPPLTPLSDSETEDVAKSENEVLQQVGKLATHDKIDDSIPDDSVAVEITIDEVATSTAVKADEVSDKSVQPKPEPKYQYSEDQWSPLNPGGKKQYDRNFLLKLQYEPKSMTRPVNLPALPDIILNETTPGQTNDTVFRHHSMELGRSSVASPPDFTPWFVRFPPNGGRRTQQGTCPTTVSVPDKGNSRTG